MILRSWHERVRRPSGAGVLWRFLVLSTQTGLGEFSCACARPTAFLRMAAHGNL